MRRALTQVPAYADLPLRERIELFVEQLTRQGLQPIDVARPSGADALLAIAATLDSRPPVPVDTGRQAQFAFDSCSHEWKTVDRTMTSTGRTFAEIDYRAFEIRIAARMWGQTDVKLSSAWKRVVHFALYMPGG